jgi:hypothetical protein
MLTLSKNLTFSLAIVAMFILGLVIAPHAMAQEEEADGPLPELNVIDQSKASGNQVAIYPEIDPAGNPTQPATAEAADTMAEIVAYLQQQDTGTQQDVVFYIRLVTGLATLQNDGADQTHPTEADHLLHIHDLSISFADRHGVGILDTDAALPIDQAQSMIENSNPRFPDGRNFKVTIVAADIPEGARFMTVSIPEGEFNHDDPSQILHGEIGPGNEPSVLRNPDKPNEIGVAGITTKTMGEGDAAMIVPNPLVLQLINADPDAPVAVSIVRVADATTGIARILPGRK